MIIVDVETTGLDAMKSSLVSIGAINFNNINKIFYEECRIWDGAEIEPKALEVNGFTDNQVKDVSKQSEAELIKRFSAWIVERGERMIAGQYISFDMSFLKEASNRAGIIFPSDKRMVDLHSIAYADHLKKGIEIELVNDRPSLSLNAILKYVGLLPEPNPHIAINGARHEAECFSRIIHGKNLLPEFAEFTVPDHFVN